MSSYHVSRRLPHEDSHTDRASYPIRQTHTTDAIFYIDEFSAQTAVSSGYKDETATKEDIRSDLVNSLPLETLHMQRSYHALLTYGGL